MSIVEVHARLGNGIILIYLALAIWGAVRFARRQGVSESYWVALVIAELVILTQGGLGIFLLYSGIRPVQGPHVLYGFICPLTTPAVYVFTRGREGRSEMLAYTVMALATVGLVAGAISMTS
jgi:hypothetical protein